MLKNPWYVKNIIMYFYCSIHLIANVICSRHITSVTIILMYFISCYRLSKTC